MSTTDARILDLMHEEIDGVISERGRSELYAYLETHPEAKRDYLELRRVGETLLSVPQIDPPADLKANVLRSIATPAGAGAVRARAAIREPWTVRFFGWLAGGHPAGGILLRYGYVAAGGILLGIALAGAVSSRFTPSTGGAGPSLDPSTLVGTLAPRGSGPDGPALKTVPVALPGGTLTATLRPADSGGYTIEFDLKGEDPVEVSLGYEAAEVDFRGVAQEARALEGLEVGPRAVQWTQAGNRRLAVLLSPRKNAGSGIDVILEFRVRGALVGEERLALPPLG